MSQYKSASNLSIDVTGIGNAIVDVLVQVEDSFLNENSLEKGSMTLIDEKMASRLESLISKSIQSSGGSAANTIAGITQLGGKAGFIGRVKDDDLGEIFSKELSLSGTIFNTPTAKNGPSTARCIIFVTPDAQRTMCTYLGASVLIEPDNLNLSIVKESKILYLEGYLWDNKSAKRAFIEAAKISRDSGGETALSLSDSFCVDRHRESFIQLIDNHVDILFANEIEINSLYKTSSTIEAIKQLRGKCKIAAITKGEEGSIILSKEGEFHIKAYKFGDAIDTTGAGDLFASGFLYGYTKGEELTICGQIGSICAGHIVTNLGSRVKISLKELVQENLRKVNK